MFRKIGRLCGAGKGTGDYVYWEGERGKIEGYIHKGEWFKEGNTLYGVNGGIFEKMDGYILDRTPTKLEEVVIDASPKEYIVDSSGNKVSYSKLLEGTEKYGYGLSVSYSKEIIPSKNVIDYLRSQYDIFNSTATAFSDFSNIGYVPSQGGSTQGASVALYFISRNLGDIATFFHNLQNLYNDEGLGKDLIITTRNATTTNNDGRKSLTTLSIYYKNSTCIGSVNY